MDKDSEANLIQPGLQAILLIKYSRSRVRPPERLLNAIFLLRKVGVQEAPLLFEQSCIGYGSPHAGGSEDSPGHHWWWLRPTRGTTQASLTLLPPHLGTSPPTQQNYPLHNPLV